MSLILNDREALRRGYIAREQQLTRCEQVMLLDGDGHGLCRQELSLPNGIETAVTWDRCMDIPYLRYRGVPVAYMGRGDERADASAPFEGRFNAGMLYTCGLVNVGPGQGDQPTHGRIHLQSAALRSVRREADALVLTGEMRESSLFGENLLLRRRLTFPLREAKVVIEDEIVNQSAYDRQVMLLYHINLGYPFLSEHTRVHFPQGTHTEPATAHARAHLGDIAHAAPPAPDFEEQDFHHRLPADESGLCCVTAENADLGLRLSLRYTADTLPILVQWRCLRSGDYVMGLEPANNHVDGCHGRGAQVLEPFQALHTRVELQLSEWTASD